MMPQPLDILDNRDPLRGAFIGSLLVHFGVVAALFVGWFWMNRTRDILGDPHPAGGPAYDVSPVSKIPIPSRQAPPNPVAADTKSSVPTAPAKEDLEKKTPVPDKNAFELARSEGRQAEKRRPGIKRRTPWPR